MSERIDARSPYVVSSSHGRESIFGRRDARLPQQARHDGVPNLTKVAALVRKTLNTKPKDGSHWTIRSMEQQTGVSRPTIHRIWHAFGLQPHRHRHFQLSTDPFFVEKVRDIIGLYLNPPTTAWFCA